MENIFNVKDFYPQNTSDTKAIQAACDACHDIGGGTVIIPKGDYTVSSVRLYSNTSVVIDSEAYLRLDPDESHYEGPRGKYDDCFTRDPRKLIGIPDGEELSYIQELSVALIRRDTDTMFYAGNAENVSITGGILDGQFQYFFEKGLRISEGYRWCGGGVESYGPKKFRPHIMVFDNCDNVNVSETKLVDFPIYGIRLIDCTGINLEKLKIEAEIKCINSDGIHLAGCKNCRIHDCHFITGDDCIAVDVGEEKPNKQDSENIVISNCSGKSAVNLVRIYSGIDVDIGCKNHWLSPDSEAVRVAKQRAVRNVTVRDCTIEAGSNAINIVSSFGAVEDIRVLNVSSTSAGAISALFLGTQNDGIIRNVTFSGLQCEGAGCVTMIGGTVDSVTGISLTDCHFSVTPRSKLYGNGMIDPFEFYWVDAFAPYNIYLRHVSDVSFTDCTVEWKNPDLDDIMEIADREKRPDFYEPFWREDMMPSAVFPCVSAYDAKNVHFKNCTLPGFGGAPSMKIEKSENVTEE